MNVDAEKILLAEKSDNKTAANYIFQFKNAGNYMDRYEALQYFGKNAMPELALGLNDRFQGLREYALTKLAATTKLLTADVVKTVEKIAGNDPSKKARARALEILGGLKDKTYLALFRSNVNDSSYSVAGAALEGIKKIDLDEGYTIAKKNMKDAKGKLQKELMEITLAKASVEDFDFMAGSYTNGGRQAKLQLTKSFGEYLEKINDGAKVKEGVEMILEFRKSIPENFKFFTERTFKDVLTKLAKAKEAQGQKELADYITKNI